MLAQRVKKGPRWRHANQKNSGILSMLLLWLQNTEVMSSAPVPSQLQIVADSKLFLRWLRAVRPRQNGRGRLLRVLL